MLNGFLNLIFLGYYMKNKILILLVFLLATQVTGSLIATPWDDALQVAKATSKGLLAVTKTGLGLAHIGASVAIPYYALKFANNHGEIESVAVNAVGTANITLNTKQYGQRTYHFNNHINNASVKTADLLPPLYIAAGGMSLISFAVGCSLLKGAYKDFKNINS